VKKARYALGALGVTPALGLMFPAPATAAAQAPEAAAKTVSLGYRQAPQAAGCTGHTHRTATHSGITMGYYSTVTGAKTCIGTVTVTYKSSASTMWVVISHLGIYTSYCCGGGKTHAFGVHKAFNNPGQVWAWVRPTVNATARWDAHAYPG